MPVFRTPRPAGDESYLAGRIEKWLTSKGYVIGAGGVSVTNVVAEDGAISGEVVVDADRDPAADIAAYQYTELPEESGTALAMASLRNAISDIRAKAPAQRSPAERAVLALTVILRELREGGV
jgi:hypothetical protein